MIVSIKWLKEFVEINETPKELADMLSSIGLEAEFSDSVAERGRKTQPKVQLMDMLPFPGTEESKRIFRYETSSTPADGQSTEEEREPESE